MGVDRKLFFPTITPFLWAVETLFLNLLTALCRFKNSCPLWLLRLRPVPLKVSFSYQFQFTSPSACRTCGWSPQERREGRACTPLHTSPGCSPQLSHSGAGLGRVPLLSWASTLPRGWCCLSDVFLALGGLCTVPTKCHFPWVAWSEAKSRKFLLYAELGMMRKKKGTCLKA